MPKVAVLYSRVFIYGGRLAGISETRYACYHPPPPTCHSAIMPRYHSHYVSLPTITAPLKISLYAHIHSSHFARARTRTHINPSKEHHFIPFHCTLYPPPPFSSQMSTQNNLHYQKKGQRLTPKHKLKEKRKKKSIEQPPSSSK